MKVVQDALRPEHRLSKKTNRRTNRADITSWAHVSHTHLKK
ncbi:hypothetical protein Z946_383 [Sulfitobacter noctilucicola]|nr:hypothetical protein Z946_383 [Sulfitobacter noctilucicola]